MKNTKKSTFSFSLSDNSAQNIADDLKIWEILKHYMLNWAKE